MTPSLSPAMQRLRAVPSPLRHLHPALLRVFSLCAAMCPLLPLLAQSAADEAETFNMLSGSVEIPRSGDDGIDIPVPRFIKTQANRIIPNGADWTSLRQAAAASTVRPFSIVHIGDSHVQADISTGILRELLQYDYGNAGRGLVSPLKMSNTNEPADYTFSSRRSWTPVKLMSASWRHTMGFTGTSISPVTNSSELTISTSERDDYNPFSSLTVFHSGKLEVTSVTAPDGSKLDFRQVPSRDYTQVILERPTTSATLHLHSAGDLTVYGATLSGERPGIFYHAIGNNGATYDTYNRIGTVGQGIAPLRPDLVIISLGTNEAFGRLDTRALTAAIDRLVGNIRQANPQAQILLTTPMECQRRSTTTRKVRVKGKNGRYRTVNRTSRSYSVNANIAPVRRAILDYGRDHAIAVWDWWDIAGGQGASSTWITNGLFAADRVHHTYKGYNLEGRLLYDALTAALSPGQPGDTPQAQH